MIDSQQQNSGQQDRNPHDESLANLLRALATPDPDAGFTQRMVRNLASQQAVASAPAKRLRLIWGLSFATATAAAIVALAVTLHHSPQAVEQVASIPPTQTVQSPQNVVIQSEVRHASSTHAGEGSASSSRKISIRPEPHQTEAELDPSQARSFPAPPMPLTEQEKLLRRIAHTGDPVELAALNAEKRRRVAAQDEVAYLQMFPPPPSGEEEDNLVLKILKETTSEN